MGQWQHTITTIGSVAAFFAVSWVGMVRAVRVNDTPEKLDALNAKFEHHELVQGTNEAKAERYRMRVETKLDVIGTNQMRIFDAVTHQKTNVDFVPFPMIDVTRIFTQPTDTP